MTFDFSRRQTVRSLLLGSGLFPAVLNELLAAEASPLAPKAPHFPGTAKRVIFIYLSGGMSHVDSFDPKPKLAEYQRDGGQQSKGSGVAMGKQTARRVRHRDHRSVSIHRGKGGRSVCDPLHARR